MSGGIGDYPTLGHYVAANFDEVAKKLKVDPEEVSLWGKDGLVNLFAASKKGDDFNIYSEEGKRYIENISISEMEIWTNKDHNFSFVLDPDPAREFEGLPGTTPAAEKPAVIAEATSPEPTAAAFIAPNPVPSAAEEAGSPEQANVSEIRQTLQGELNRILTEYARVEAEPSSLPRTRRLGELKQQIAKIEELLRMSQGDTPVEEVIADRLAEIEAGQKGMGFIARYLQGNELEKQNLEGLSELLKSLQGNTPVEAAEANQGTQTSAGTAHANSLEAVRQELEELARATEGDSAELGGAARRARELAKEIDVLLQPPANGS